MNILVTGADGFVGGHLTKLLRSRAGNKVTGTTRQTSDRLYKCDLLSYDDVEKALRETQPDVIYHLAAFSSPALSFDHPEVAINSTQTMQINLYQACLKLDIRPKFLVISSGQIYGKAGKPEDLPLTEASPLHFNSPYSVAKVGQENLANFYESRGFTSVIARPFNHIGPGQQPGFLVSDLTKQIAELELKGEGTLKVGNLDSRRDFTDVRDIVNAYELLAAKSKPEIYNVCSGKSTSGQEILDMLLELSGAKITVEKDPARLRPSDIPDLYGDMSKLHRVTGWEPVIDLRTTLADTLEYWRGQVSTT
ncbi:MAG TPA: GDP-mannose 4,6-dehydratase [Candidatus Polarisedimenticolaceae bacterium]|nr:GDP-mannose 4,6-dehydratase [Candidatus Polarisedimenticolaceae bacterium]